MTASSGIEFRNVTKRYGTDAVGAAGRQGHQLRRCRRGTLTTILGPSGCGKTTTLRMIAGLESPTAGQILIDGHDVTTLGPAERNVSMMFQSYALFPHMNVLENVGYGLRMSRRRRRARRAQRARDGAATASAWSASTTRLPSELSGGQQQRVALARALVLEPAVLLFDEPLSNLDARLRREMREEIRALQQRLKLTVAYVTHDQSEALAVSDQIIVMDHGVIAQARHAAAAVRAPGERVRRRLHGRGDAVRRRGSADGAACGSARCACTPRHALPAGAVKVAVRPEAWAVAAGRATGRCRRRVLKQAYLGSIVELTLATALGEIFVVSPQVERGWAVGDTLALALPGTHGVSLLG